MTDDTPKALDRFNIIRTIPNWRDYVIFEKKTATKDQINTKAHDLLVCIIGAEDAELLSVAATGPVSKSDTEHVERIVSGSANNSMVSGLLRELYPVLWDKHKPTRTFWVVVGSHRSDGKMFPEESQAKLFVEWAAKRDDADVTQFRVIKVTM